MKKLLAVILFCSLLSFASIASAANWEWIASDDKIGFFFDTQSFQKVAYSENYTVWVKKQYTEAYGEEVAKKYEYKEALSYILSKQEFDFKNQQTRVLVSVVYAKSGETLDYSNAVSQWMHIIPDSFGEALINKTYSHYKKYYK